MKTEDKPLLVLGGMVRIRYLLFVKITNRIPTGGRMKIFKDRIELDFLWFRKKIYFKDLDFVDVRGNLSLLFAYGKKYSFASYLGTPDKIKKAVRLLRQLHVKIKKDKKFIKFSPYN